jgi:uncharacterized repeat protein (TIGR03803 family)
MGPLENAPAQYFQLKTLASFDGTNGANPNAGLILTTNGYFYGTTYSGGASNIGVIFEITTDGSLTTPVNFNSTNGANPNAALTQGADGFLYGSTYYGGTNVNGGTLFKFDPTNGILSPLFSFNGVSSANGKRPKAALIVGSSGVFYGSTFLGGTGYGTLFQFSAGNGLSTLTSFASTNGAFPSAALTSGQGGLLYGVTSQGGADNLGTAFSLDTNSQTLKMLATFNGANGSIPAAPLVLGTDGYFYGTTSAGGQQNLGTVFRLSTNGDLTALVSFLGTNGASPNASLVLGMDGRFYGTTTQGGNTNLNGGAGFGTVFRLNPDNSVTTLINFDSTNGALPYGALAVGNDGNLYGTTSQGGAYNDGTVFQLTPLPQPPLNISWAGDSVILSWTNPVYSLQAAPEVTGIYTNLPESISPYTNSIAGDRRFFRLIAN